MCTFTGIDIFRWLLTGISLILTVVGVIKHAKHEYDKSITIFAISIAINIINLIIGNLAI